MKHVIFIIGCLTLFLNCKNNTSSGIDKQSAEETKIQPTSTLSVLPSKYLIVPPDSDYTGDYIDRYKSGVVKFTGFFRFGERHGQWMAFYENGILWSECYYDKGKKHGLSKVYFPNGQAQYIGWYKNDLQDSVWVYYNEEGKVLEKRAFHKGEEVAVPN